MPDDHHNRLLYANRELRNFLERVNHLVHGTGEIAAVDLRALGQLLKSMAPEIAASSRDASADAALQAQVREYTGNLRALQASLEQVRCVLLARRAQIEAAQQHVDGFQGWASAYRQTA